MWSYWGVLVSALEPITSWGLPLSNSHAEWANCLVVAIGTPLLSQLMLAYFVCGFCSHCGVTAQWKGVCWGLQGTRMELIWYPRTIGLTWSSIPASFQWSSDLTPDSVILFHKYMGQDFRFHRGYEKHEPPGFPLWKRNRGRWKLISWLFSLPRHLWEKLIPQTTSTSWSLPQGTCSAWPRRELLCVAS